MRVPSNIGRWSIFWCFLSLCWSLSLNLSALGSRLKNAFIFQQQWCKQKGTVYLCEKTAITYLPPRIGVNGLMAKASALCEAPRRAKRIENLITWDFLDAMCTSRVAFSRWWRRCWKCESTEDSQIADLYYTDAFPLYFKLWALQHVASVRSPIPRSSKFFERCAI